MFLDHLWELVYHITELMISNEGMKNITEIVKHFQESGSLNKENEAKEQKDGFSGVIGYIMC